MTARDLLVDRLAALAEGRPDAPALIDVGASPIDFAAYHRTACAFGAACLAGDRPAGFVVSIWAEGCAAWAIAAMGALLAGGVYVGLYAGSTAEQAAALVAHAKAQILVTEDAAHYRCLAAHLPAQHDLRTVVLLRGPVDPGCVAFADHLAAGADGRAGLSARTARIGPDDLAALLYTSGTTGAPKAVMLTHENLAWTARAVLDALGGASTDDRVVSYLPLSHIIEQAFSIHLAVTAGYSVHFSGGIEHILPALCANRPTIFIAVPRVWEKLRAAVLRVAGGGDPGLVGAAQAAAAQAGAARLAGRALPGELAAAERRAEAEVLGPLRRAVGLDRVRVALSGSAPLRRELLDDLLSFGLVVREAYGQSEGSGPTSLNTPTTGGTRPGTVGRPLPGVEVRIAGDGEILVRGKNVFAGYLGDPAATEAVLRDGFLASGDVGELDADGFLRITDRKRDLIKTSGGKFIAPQPLEARLTDCPLISQAVVVGEGRHYVAALVTIAPDKAAAWAAARGLSPEPERLAREPALLAELQAHVDQINAMLARYESIKRFAVLPRELSVLAGEVTPSQKLRRAAIAARYSAEIDAMYAAD